MTTGGRKRGQAFDLGVDIRFLGEIKGRYILVKPGTFNFNLIHEVQFCILAETEEISKK
jgi:hypothetical protein